MDAANLTEKYILWSNILDLRSRGINIARTARRLGVSRNTVRHLQSLSLEEVLQHKERHYKLHAYEQAQGGHQRSDKRDPEKLYQELRDKSR